MPSRYRAAVRKTLGLAPGSGLVLAPASPREVAFRTANCGWHTRGVSQSPDPRGPDEPCVLLKLGEIVLKGRNRQQFERILQGNIRADLRDTGVPVDLRQREGVILLRVADGQERGEPGWTQAAAVLAERVRDVPGIVRVCQPLRVAKTPEAVSAAAVAMTKGAAGTFAIRARRRDKRFPLTSGQLSVLIGREIQEAHGLGVDLRHPDTEVFIEVDQD